MSRAGMSFVVAGVLFALGLLPAGAQAAVTGSTDAAAVAAAIGDGTPGLVTGASFTIPGPIAECANGEDDDINGQVDLADPGCTNANDDSELDELADSFGVPECQNRFDDNGDRDVDADDIGCNGSTDASEDAGRSSPSARRAPRMTSIPTAARSGPTRTAPH